MKKRIINVASVGPEVPLAVLAALAVSTARVEVFSAAHGRSVGFCQKYWVDGDSLWAEAQLADDATEDFAGVHAESVIAMKGARAVLCGVVLTRLPPGMIGQAALGKPFADAVRTVIEGAGFKPRGSA